MPIRDQQADARKARHISAKAAWLLALTLSAPLFAQAAEALRVVRDPVTGELRGPTAAEVTAFERAEAQLRKQQGKAQPAAPVEVRHPDGSVELKLGEDSRMYSVVRANEDGTLATACLPANQAKAYVLSGKPAAKAKAKVLTQAKQGHSHD